jgi:hypothetical protein
MTEELLERDEKASEFAAIHCQEEETRLKDMGVRPLRMQPKNFGIVLSECHDPPVIVNRIEMFTNFDFEQRISQLMVGASIEYPFKDGYMYANVLLLTEKMAMPLLVPYIYPKEYCGQQNNLQEWLLINSKGMRARLSLNSFHAV